MGESAHPRVVLDGFSLTLEELVAIARDPRVAVECAPEGLERVDRGRRLIEGIAQRYRERFEAFRRGEAGAPPVQDYGITTGFGEFKDIPVSADELEALQRNILLSHAVGTGYTADADDPGNYYTGEVVRATLALRLNTFLKGHSGVRREMVAAVAAMLNRGIIPLVPVHGSVGSSGDLCPLAHLFVVLLGHGRYWRALTPGDLAVRPRELRRPGEHLEADLGLAPPAPSFKEGLALVNGATLSAAMLALAVHDAEALVTAADVAAALSLEAACGCARAFDPKVHAARGQRGQMDSAANLRALTAGSALVDAAGAVQDPYSLRCAPAVHGASRDAVAYARMVVERELNAATDNPLFFPGAGSEAHAEAPWDGDFRANWPAGYDGDERASYSAGNFHGQPVGLAADFLAMAVAELADISERRSQLLLDQGHNRGLPANLIAHRGVNTGMMILQYCAAGIVSENKVLSHPASVDSIPTSADSEDHNAMATIAARKLRTVVGNTEAVLAIELLVAAQAVDWRVGYGRPPGRPDAAAEAGTDASRPTGGEADGREERLRFEAATGAGQRQAIAERLGAGSRVAYLAVREVAPPMVADRPLDGDILAVRRLLGRHTLTRQVAAAVDGQLAAVPQLREEPS